MFEKTAGQILKSNCLGKVWETTDMAWRMWQVNTMAPSGAWVMDVSYRELLLALGSLHPATENLPARMRNGITTEAGHIWAMSERWAHSSFWSCPLCSQWSSAHWAPRPGCRQEHKPDSVAWSPSLSPTLWLLILFIGTISYVVADVGMIFPLFYAPPPTVLLVTELWSIFSKISFKLISPFHLCGRALVQTLLSSSNSY